MDTIKAIQNIKFFDLINRTQKSLLEINTG